MTDHLRHSLDYFTPEAAKRYPPATEEMLSMAEQRLQVALPPSLRQFLMVSNGCALPNDFTIFGIRMPGEPTWDDLVESSLQDREHWSPKNLITLTSEGTGDAWILLPDQAGGSTEYPVAKIDHETGEIMAYGASSFERFLWFQLDRMQRFFEPDGAKKPAYGAYIGEAPDDYEGDVDEWDPEEPYLPWPYDDLDWILQHDPALARLRPPDCAEWISSHVWPRQIKITTMRSKRRPFGS